MHELEKLKKMLCEELEEYGSKGKLDMGSLNVIDTLSHAVKNLDKIIEGKEGEYSNYSMNNYGDGSYARYNGRRYSRDRMGSYEGSYEGSYGDGSYARGRGRYAKRDSMGRYSSEGYSRAAEDITDQLRDLMDQAPDEQTKEDIKRLMERMDKIK